MRELETYSIETDQVVLLVFTDGRRQRVRVSQLMYHLSPSDLKQVEAGLKLRRHFLRSHMPKAALALAAGGALSWFVISGRPLAGLTPQEALPVEARPDATKVTRLIQQQPVSPAPVPSSSPPLAPTPAIAVKPSARQVAARKAKPTPKPAPKSVERLVLPTPTIKLPEVAIAPTPLPTALPGPGDVLGESTGPAPTPTPAPTPIPEANQPGP